MKCVVLIFIAIFVFLLNAEDPPSRWQEHCFDHRQDLTRVYFNDEVAIYFDDDMDKSITWPNQYFTDVWKYVKSVYGDFGSDNRLYAIFHANKYGGGQKNLI